MKDFNWNEFKKGKIAVHCPEEYLAEHFFSKCIENGIKDTFITVDSWQTKKENTCYRFDNCPSVAFCDKNYYSEQGYKIIEWKPNNKSEGDSKMELSVLKDKVTELETTLSELKSEIEKKENEIKAEKVDKVWKPKDGERYYYLYSDGDISGGDIWRDNTIDNKRYKLGNCFKTEEEATKERDKHILLRELEIWALENNEEEIDWSNRRQVKYFIYFDHNDNELNTDWYNYLQESQLPHFTSLELTEQAIEIFGDRLKELVFS